MTTDIDAFLNSELSAWPMADENFKRIRDSLTDGNRTVISDGDSAWQTVKLFVNHRRASITAKTDAASIAARRCFLCSTNRPGFQSSKRWRDYEILINPYPLASTHLTIPSISHCPQSIEGRIPDMAELAVELEGMCVFYNGPRCGASAPDHLHFQAVSREAVTNFFNNVLPKEEIVNPSAHATDDGEAKLYSCTASPFPFFIIEAQDAVKLETMIMKIVSALKAIRPESGEEPMMNIAMRYDSTSRLITTFVIPRAKHRPECYGQEDGQMLVSPATIEMLGTIVCSRRDDFDRLNLTEANRILSEVGLNKDDFSKVIGKL